MGRIWTEAGLKPHLTKSLKVSNDPMGVGAEGGIAIDRDAARWGGELIDCAGGLAEVERSDAVPVAIAPVARPGVGPDLFVTAPDPTRNTIAGSLNLGGRTIAFGGIETVAGDTAIRGAYGDDLNWACCPPRPIPSWR